MEIHDTTSRGEQGRVIAIDATGRRGSPPTGRIVVDIDGSRCSIDALRWAAHQAELTGATVDAVMHLSK